MITASLEIFPTKQIKKTLDTSISELSFDNEKYDYLPIPSVALLPIDHYSIDQYGAKIYTDENVYLDEITDISWSITDYRASKSSSLFYSNNNGKYWENIVIDIPTVNDGMESENKGIYRWEFTESKFVADMAGKIQYRIWGESPDPEDLASGQQIITKVFPTGSEFLIKIVSNVYDNLSETVEDVSDSVFSIQGRLNPRFSYTCTLHGIFKYLSPQISILGQIGETYQLVSYIYSSDIGIGTSFNNSPPVVIVDAFIDRSLVQSNSSVQFSTPTNFVDRPMSHG